MTENQSKPRTADGVEFELGMTVWKIFDNEFGSNRYRPFLALEVGKDSHEMQQRGGQVFRLGHGPGPDPWRLTFTISETYADRSNAVRRQVELLREHAANVTKEADEIERGLNG